MSLRTPSSQDAELRKLTTDYDASYDIVPTDSSTYPWQEDCGDCLIMCMQIEFIGQSMAGWQVLGSHFLTRHRFLFVVAPEDQPATWSRTWPQKMP